MHLGYYNRFLDDEFYIASIWVLGNHEWKLHAKKNSENISLDLSAKKTK